MSDWTKVTLLGCEFRSNLQPPGEASWSRASKPTQTISRLREASTLRRAGGPRGGHYWSPGGHYRSTRHMPHSRDFKKHKPEAPEWLSWLSLRFLLSAQVTISWSRQRAPHQAPRLEGGYLRFSLPLPLPPSPSLK